MKTYIYLLLFLLILPVQAEPEIYIRNRPIQNARTQGTERYVPVTELEGYLNDAEIERLSINFESGEIRVDENLLDAGMILGEPALAPLLAIAEALGFERRVSKELGIVDYVPPRALEKKVDLPKRAGGADYRIAEQRMQKAIAQYRLSSNAEYTERVQRLGQELANSSDMPTLKWNFFVLADSSPNAACTGAGWVYVTEGLMRTKLTDDELAGVLAHELGHGCRKDLEEDRYNRGVMKGLEGELGRLEQREAEIVAKLRVLYAEADIIKARAQEASRLGAAGLYEQYRQQYQEYAAAISDLERERAAVRRRAAEATKKWEVKDDLVNSSFHRQKDEIDADIKGIQYATRAGYSPDGLQKALKKLADSGVKKFGRAAYSGGYNHPPIPTRLGVMQKVLDDWSKSGRR